MEFEIVCQNVEASLRGDCSKVSHFWRMYRFDCKKLERGLCFVTMTYTKSQNSVRTKIRMTREVIGLDCGLKYVNYSGLLKLKSRKRLKRKNAASSLRS